MKNEEEEESKIKEDDIDFSVDDQPIGGDPVQPGLDEDLDAYQYPQKDERPDNQEDNKIPEINPLIGTSPGLDYRLSEPEQYFPGSTGLKPY